MPRAGPCHRELRALRAAFFRPGLQDTCGALIDFATADQRMETGCLFYKIRAGKHRLGPQAILHVAQFAEDSGFEGASVLFTWASGGRLSRYVYDMNSALVARTHLIDAAQIVARSIANDYHIFAHSMGGFLTMEALVYAVQTDRFDRRGRLTVSGIGVPLLLLLEKSSKGLP